MGPPTPASGSRPASSLSAKPLWVWETYIYSVPVTALAAFPSGGFTSMQSCFLSRHYCVSAWKCSESKSAARVLHKVLRRPLSPSVTLWGNNPEGELNIHKELQLSLWGEVVWKYHLNESFWAISKIAQMGPALWLAIEKDGLCPYVWCPCMCTMPNVCPTMCLIRPDWAHSVYHVSNVLIRPCAIPPKWAMSANTDKVARTQG